jgi:hypothetical protein
MIVLEGLGKGIALISDRVRHLMGQNGPRKVALSLEWARMAYLIARLVDIETIPTFVVPNTAICRIGGQITGQDAILGERAFTEAIFAKLRAITDQTAHAWVGGGLGSLRIGLATAC